MRTCLVVLVSLLVACGNKKEEAAKTDPPAPTTPVSKDPPQDPPKDPPKDPPADPPAKETPPPSTTDATPIDCAALLAAADVETACGAKLEVTTKAAQIKLKEERCRIAIAEAGKRAPNVTVFVLEFATPASAESMVKLEKVAETKEVAGVGDRAWSTVSEKKDLKITMNTAGAQKGRFLVKAQADKSSLNPKPACTIDQLLALVEVVVGKLP